MALVALGFVSVVGTMIGILIVLSGAMRSFQLSWNFLKKVMKGE